MRNAARILRAWPLVLIALLASVAALAGCSVKKTLVPNVPPQTGLFVQGQVDTVNHLVHLYWYGNDTDGFVVAFDVRMLDPQAPADTQWVRTTRTDSLIAAYTPTGLSKPVFEVRAIDDDGAVDPTPATEQFIFTNQAPIVDFQSPPGIRDTTFASVTLGWYGADPDGNGAKMVYRVWLNGNEANTDITQNKFITIATDRFRQNGQLLSGFRTVYVQAIDDGGRAGNVDSTTWYVRAPVAGTRARLLIIDDVPSTNPGNASIDSMWINTAVRNLPADEWSLLRLETTQPFRSSEDVRQTFALFENVLWYRSTQTNFSTLLSDYQNGIAAYLDAGGSFTIEGLDLIQGVAASGPLTADWTTRYCGSRGLYKFETTVPGDSSAVWGIAPSNNGLPAGLLRSTLLADSVRTLQIYSGLRGFDVVDTNDVLLWAPPNQLTPSNPINLPVAVSVPQPSGGRMTVITVPLRGMDRFRTVPRFMAKLFEHLGLIGP